MNSSTTEIPPKLSMDDLQTRWECSRSTVIRDIRRFGLRPSKMRGLQPFFDLASVEAMEAVRLAERAQQIGLPVASERILTVKEARRRAGAGRKEVAK